MDRTIFVSSPDDMAQGTDFDWRHEREIGSTNDPLLAAPFGDSPARPVALRADHQTKGRGRRGRQWIGDPSRALTFSLALERRIEQAITLSGFSLVVGLALCEQLRARCPGLALKWPNDLLRNGGKAGGILIETRRQGRIERVVVGIGLNLLAPKADTTPGSPVALAPAGLFDTALEPTQVASLMRECARAVRRAFDDFVQTGFRPYAAHWSRFDAFAGRSVSLLEAGHTIASGVVLGVDEQGALRLLVDGMQRSFAIGEVSLRARTGP